MTREHGMIPGPSTHMPETPGYADRAGRDVATYIQIYNAAATQTVANRSHAYRQASRICDPYHPP